MSKCPLFSVGVRCFLSVVVTQQWEPHQLDINNAFLHGDLDEELYMKLPPGATCSSPTKVCRLQKSLYGLRQEPRQWFTKFSCKLYATDLFIRMSTTHFLLIGKATFLWLFWFMLMISF